MAKRHYDQSADKDEFLVESAGDFNSSSGDLTVICNGIRINCHEYVICHRSGWFKTAEASGFRERGASEIELKDEADAQVIQAMLEFCYNFKYTNPKENSAIFHVRMFAAAEKYFVRNLKQLAADRFIEVAGDESDEHLSLAIEEAYTMTTDSGKILRRAIFEISRDRAQNASSWGSQPAGSLEKLLDTIPAYAADMARGSLGNRDFRKRQYKCPGGTCGKTFWAIMVDGQEYTHSCPSHNASGRPSFYKKSGEEWKSKHEATLSASTPAPDTPNPSASLFAPSATPRLGLFGSSTNL